MNGNGKTSNRKGMMLHWVFLALAILGAYFVWQKYIAKKL